MRSHGLARMFYVGFSNGLQHAAVLILYQYEAFFAARKGESSSNLHSIHDVNCERFQRLNI